MSGICPDCPVRLYRRHSRPVHSIVDYVMHCIAAVARRQFRNPAADQEGSGLSCTRRCTIRGKSVNKRSQNELKPQGSTQVRTAFCSIRASFFSRAPRQDKRTPAPHSGVLENLGCFLMGLGSQTQLGGESLALVRNAKQSRKSLGETPAGSKPFSNPWFRPQANHGGKISSAA